jgi:hypothetical protein
MKIDDLAHVRFDDVVKKKDPKMAEMDKKFPILDAEYHAAQNLNEKHKAAQSFSKFLKLAHAMVQELGYTTSGEDQKTYELFNALEQIK